MIGDEKNPEVRRFIEQEQKHRDSKTFKFEWTGTRVPKSVTFPDGTEREVGYMRDGILMFKDDSSATYERVVDDLNRPKQKIKITFLEG